VDSRHLPALRYIARRNADRQMTHTADIGDDRAMEIFRNQWEVYQKFLQYDYLANGAACRELTRFLQREADRPFDFLDLACGDASGVANALKPTRIARYTGVDLSAPALSFARENISALACTIELQENDFVAAVAQRSRPIDIAWISLSLHHLETAGKLELLRLVSERLETSGAFLIYEPTFEENEPRTAYMDRLEKIGRQHWTALSKIEFNEALNHIRNCDLPETASTWIALGREAGFNRVTELYRSPYDLFRLYAYRR
jgi:hypothetical protein